MKRGIDVVMRHVADRIDMDHRRDDRHDDEHHAPSAYRGAATRDLDAAGVDPGGDRAPHRVRRLSATI